MSAETRSPVRGARHAWLGGLAALLLAAAGCVTSSLRGDVRAVRSLANVPVLPALRPGQTDELTPREAEQLIDAPLDADRAVRIALLHNRELRARLRELGVERGQLMQAGLIANPDIEAEFSPERDSRVELRAEYDVMSFVLTPMRKRAAQHDLDAARLAIAGDVVELGYQVRSTCYALQAAEQQLRVAQRTLDALAAGRDAAVALLEAGNLRAIDAASQISAFERARIAVAKLELSAAEQREALQRLLGLHGAAAGWTLSAELAPVPETPAALQNVEQRVLAANLDLRATAQRLEAIAKRTGVTRTQGLLPHIDLDVHALIGNPEAGETNNVRWGGGVGVDVPLFDRQQGKLRVHEAEFDSTLERYQGLAIDLRSAARELAARVTSAQRRALQYASVIVPAQETVMAQTILQYNAMQIGVFQLLEARRGQLEVALDYVETQREYWSASAALDALLAGRRVGVGPERAGAALPRAKEAENEGGH
jgi:outer membrane protein, heavy metal efflux system